MLTTAEVAERWGRSQKTVQALIKQKRLKAVLFGKTYLIAESDADRYEFRPPGRPSSNGHRLARGQGTSKSPRRRATKAREKEPKAKL